MQLIRIISTELTTWACPNQNLSRTTPACGTGFRQGIKGSFRKVASRENCTPVKTIKTAVEGHAQAEIIEERFT
jgi:hypothetical protein